MGKIEFYKYILQYFQLEIHTRERERGKERGRGILCYYIAQKMIFLLSEVNFGKNNMKHF